MKNLNDVKGRCSRQAGSPYLRMGRAETNNDMDAGF